MTALRLLAVGFSLALRRDLAHRANLLFDAVLALAGLLSTLATVLVVFTRTDQLAGWTRPATFVLIGTFEVVSGLKATFVDPSLATFPGQGIREGRLDHHLLQPAPTLFLATLGTAAPLAGLQIPAGLAVVALGARDCAVSPGTVAAWFLLVALAAVVTWAVGTLLAALAFWLPKIELHMMYGTAWQLGRYPVDLYARPVRLLLTHVLPLALIATVPAAALTRPLDPRVPATAAGTGALLVLLAVAVWRRGLRRYVGAGS